MSADKADPPLSPPPLKGAQAPAARPVVDVRDILGAAREAILVHQGEHYRLRVTANDKLILTK